MLVIGVGLKPSAVASLQCLRQQCMQLLANAVSRFFNPELGPFTIVGTPEQLLLKLSQEPRKGGCIGA